MYFPQPVFNAEREKAAYDEAVANGWDAWVAACNGTEVPVLDRANRWVLRVFNPATGRHGWLDFATDIVEED